MKRWQRAAAEFALLTAFGIFLGAIGPFDTEDMPILNRYVYWVICIVGGGFIGIGVDALIGRRFADMRLAVLVTSVAMTPAVTLMVEIVGSIIGNRILSVPHYFENLLNVFIISLPVMTVRAMAWRRPGHVVETRTVIAPPLPEAEAAFRRRLSAKRRAARLIAVEADDHYLRVHTDAGTEMITARMADALTDLQGAHGFQLHRSWWVAGDAINSVKWRRGGGGDTLLCDGSIAPVSRTFAPALKEAGW